MRCVEVNDATLCYVSSTTKNEYVCVVSLLLEVDFGTQNTKLNMFSVWVAVGDRLRATLAGLTETIPFYAYKLFFLSSQSVNCFGVSFRLPRNNFKVIFLVEFMKFY
jgi:hypothetical protein